MRYVVLWSALPTLHTCMPFGLGRELSHPISSREITHMLLLSFRIGVEMQKLSEFEMEFS